MGVDRKLKKWSIKNTKRFHHFILENRSFRQININFTGSDDIPQARTYSTSGNFENFKGKIHKGGHL